jgi:hypothetical protein
MQVRPHVIDELLQRVRSEYLEMPGLRLTLPQAARFWSLDHRTCERLLNGLVNARFLVLTSDGLYTRAGSPREHTSRPRSDLLPSITLKQGAALGSAAEE